MYVYAGAIWVYARALEDGLDALLTRSRSEADLAALKTGLPLSLLALLVQNALLTRSRSEADLAALKTGLLLSLLALLVQKCKY
jgi:hypothetical protein